MFLDLGVVFLLGLVFGVLVKIVWWWWLAMVRFEISFVLRLDLGLQLGFVIGLGKGLWLYYV